MSDDERDIISKAVEHLRNLEVLAVDKSDDNNERDDDDEDDEDDPDQSTHNEIVSKLAHGCDDHGIHCLLSVCLKHLFVIK
jgi:hypothetical protein